MKSTSLLPAQISKHTSMRTKILNRSASLVLGFAILLTAGLARAQSFRGPDTRPHHTAQAVRINFPIGTPSASQIWALQCLDKILFPANFAGIYPDANGSASCSTNPSENDTYTLKVAGSQIGQMTLAGPSAITYVNSWVSSGASGSSNTINTSGGTQMAVNDVCLIGMAFYNGASFSSITGGAGGTWTPAVSTFTNGSSTNSLAVYYHVATSSDIGATFTVNFSAGAFSVVGMSCFRTANISSPIDAAGSGSTGGSTSATAAGVTTSNANDAVLYCNAITGTTTQTVPSGFTQTFNVQYSAGTNYGLFCGYLIGYTSGTAETGTLGASEFWDAVLTALSPNSSGTACTPTFITNSGQPQSCLAGQRLELDAPATVSGAGIAIGIGGHVP
jgi:hypothetical protein